MQAGDYIFIHTQYGQGIDIAGAVCEIINMTGERPEGIREKDIGGLTMRAQDIMLVRVDYIDAGYELTCEAKVGKYYRLRTWYERTWAPTRLSAGKTYEGLI